MNRRSTTTPCTYSTMQRYDHVSDVAWLHTPVYACTYAVLEWRVTGTTTADMHYHCGEYMQSHSLLHQGSMSQFMALMLCTCGVCRCDCEMPWSTSASTQQEHHSCSVVILWDTHTKRCCIVCIHTDLSHLLPLVSGVVFDLSQHLLIAVYGT